MTLTLDFTKMEGAGNDYVYVDALRDPSAREIDAERWPEIARVVSDRHFGIGSDGLILLSRAPSGELQMSMWNRDGSRGAMCGNGIRCLAKLAYDHQHVRETHFAIATDTGTKTVELLCKNREVTGARVVMGLATVDPNPRQAQADGRTWSYLAGDVGNPHAVIFCDEELDTVPVLSVGAALQQQIAGGVNVEFVHVRADRTLALRTFERGSGETLACGTGACAAGLAALVTQRVAGPRVHLRLRGGELFVERLGTALVLEGDARTVFEGRIKIE